MNSRSPQAQVPFPVEEKNPRLSHLLRSLSAMGRMKIKLWEDAVFVFATLPVDPDAARKILPRFMWLTSPCQATLFIANYPKTAFTVAYNEAALLLHVATPLGRGVHCPWMVVDDDTAMIYGREVLGYPKKLADIPFADDGAKITAGVTRRNTRVVALEATRIVEEPDPGPVMGVKTFNIGGMGQWFSFNPVWMFTPREAVHEAFTATADVMINDSDHDPIARLIAPHAGPVPARVARIDIFGARTLIPVWLTGLRVFRNTFNLRYR